MAAERQRDAGKDHQVWTAWHRIVLRWSAVCDIVAQDELVDEDAAVAADVADTGTLPLCCRDEASHRT